LLCENLLGFASDDLAIKPSQFRAEHAAALAARVVKDRKWLTIDRLCRAVAHCSRNRIPITGSPADFLPAVVQAMLSSGDCPTVDGLVGEVVGRLVQWESDHPDAESPQWQGRLVRAQPKPDVLAAWAQAARAPHAVIAAVNDVVNASTD
jgi:hypothetical protein